MSVLPELGVISFARGIPAPEMLPVEQLAECCERALSRHGKTALNYGSPEGFAPLREWIAARHGVTPERVIVTPGSLVAMNLLVRHLLPVPRRVIVEAPSYDRMLHLLGAARASVVTIGRTDGGLELDRLAGMLAAGHDPAFLYVLPTFHNPRAARSRARSASSSPTSRSSTGSSSIEDDPYGLLRLDGEPEPSIHQLLRERGGDELAVHMSSFSKSVAPGLRVGYVVLPERLVPAITALALSLYVSPPLLAQAQLFEFLDAGLLEPHLERVCALLRPRRDALLDVLGDRLPAGAQLDASRWWLLRLARAAGAARHAASSRGRARSAGVSFVPGAGFFTGADRAGARSARLSFSYPPVEDVRVGAERLAALLAVAEQG